jgi:hypothetical protein
MFYEGRGDGGKWPGREADHSSPSDSNNLYSPTLLSGLLLSSISVNYKYISTLFTEYCKSEKTKYMLMSCHQNVEEHHNVQTASAHTEIFGPKKDEVA